MVSPTPIAPPQVPTPASIAANNDNNSRNKTNTTKAKAKTKSATASNGHTVAAAPASPLPPPPPPKSSRLSLKTRQQQQHNEKDVPEKQCGPVNGLSQKNGRINGKTKVAASRNGNGVSPMNGFNSKLIKLKQSQKDMELQEKEDFRLAQILQNYENNKGTSSSVGSYYNGNGTTRYSLRSRGKTIGTANGILPRIANSVAPSDTTASDTSSIVENNVQIQNTRRRRGKRGAAEVENYFNLLTEEFSDEKIFPRRTRNRQ